MPFTCYVALTGWELVSSNGFPATMNPAARWALVDNVTGLGVTSLSNGRWPSDWGLPVGITPEDFRVGVESGIQAIETATPGLVFVWLGGYDHSHRGPGGVRMEVPPRRP